MTKVKELRNVYLGRYLSNMETLPVNPDTIHIVDSITSIDKHTYRKDWLKVYKKSRKLIEYLEEKTEINDEETHFFYCLSPLLDDLYHLSYTALRKIYEEEPALKNEEWDSMDEFLATVHNLYGDAFCKTIPPSPRKVAYNRLMIMTRKEADVSQENENMLETLENIKNRLDSVISIVYSENEMDTPIYGNLESILADAENELNDIKEKLSQQ